MTTVPNQIPEAVIERLWARLPGDASLTLDEVASALDGCYSPLRAHFLQEFREALKSEGVTDWINFEEDGPITDGKHWASAIDLAFQFLSQPVQEEACKRCGGTRQRITQDPDPLARVVPCPDCQQEPNDAS